MGAGGQRPQLGGLEQRAGDFSSRDYWIACGIFLVTLSVYVLTSPGRIDIIDAQYRYEVAQNLLRYGRPYVTDPALSSPTFRVLGPDGSFYSNFGFAGTGFSLPLVWLGNLCDAGKGETTRFLFSLTSCIFGALCALVLYFFYRELRVSRQSAVLWTAVSSFATLLWPLSASSFENVERGFLAFLAVYLGYRSAKQRSKALALAGGMSAGLLLLYRWYMGFMLPLLALSVLSPPAATKDPSLAGQLRRPWTPSPLLTKAIQLLDNIFDDLWTAMVRGEAASENRRRVVAFLEGTTIGLVGMVAYNLERFNSLFHSGQTIIIPVVVANPLVGFLTLFVSPGKSVFLYSPPLILGFLGIGYLWRRERWLTYAILGATLIWVALMCGTFSTGGDWCWGPRYFVNVMPLWALPFPFLRPGKFLRRLAIAIVGLGLVVQLMAVSMDFQRFFFERRLSIFFFVQDTWYYFKHSALLARPSEILSLKEGVPSTASRFSPTPYPGLLTYCVFGPPGNTLYMADRWVRGFEVFFLPRPWPFWLRDIEPSRRPINLSAWLLGCLALFMLGAAFIVWGVHHPQSRAAPVSAR